MFQAQGETDNVSTYTLAPTQPRKKCMILEILEVRSDRTFTLH